MIVHVVIMNNREETRLLTMQQVGLEAKTFLKWQICTFCSPLYDNAVAKGEHNLLYIAKGHKPNLTFYGECQPN